jgi:hypothetical protein
VILRAVFIFLNYTIQGASIKYGICVNSDNYSLFETEGDARAMNEREHEVSCPYRKRRPHESMAYVSESKVRCGRERKVETKELTARCEISGG